MRTVLPTVLRVILLAFLAVSSSAILYATVMNERTVESLADRRVPCETVHFSSGSPLHGVLKVAEEKRCDVIVTSTDLQAAMNTLSFVNAARTNGKVRIPMLIHHAV